MNQSSAKSKGSDFKLLKANNRTQSTGQREKLNTNCQCVRAFEEEPQQQNYSCQNCEQNIEKVTSLKKNMIVIEYQNAKLTQQIQKIKKQNANLKLKLSEKIQIKINSCQNGGLLTMKQDLQAQLFQSKLLNQLLMVGQYTKLDNEIKDKLDQIFMEKLVLQEQLEQKTRIINNTVLYPIYHYDSRIKNLRNAVLYFYNIATKECKKAQQLIKLMKKETENMKGKLKLEIQSAISHQFQSFHEEKLSKTMTPVNQMKQNIKSMVLQRKIEYQKSSTTNKSKLLKQQKQDKEKVKNLTDKQSKSKSKAQKKNKRNKEQLSQQVKDIQRKQEKFNRPCCIKYTE